MKITKETLAILKNFSQIQQGITIRCDKSHLVSVSEGGGILANAPIVEEFPLNFTIYDIGQFLSAITLFREPDFDFQPDHVSISDTEAGTKTLYYYSAENLVSEPPCDALHIDSFKVVIDIKEDVLKSVLKSANIMALKDLRIMNDGTDIVLQAFDKEGDTKNVFGIIIQNDYQGEDFQAHLLVTSMVIIADDYTVGIVNMGGTLASQFTGTGESPNRYWLALEPSSTLSE